MQSKGCELGASLQTAAVRETAAGEVLTKSPAHGSSSVRDFCFSLLGSVRVEIGVTGTPSVRETSIGTKNLVYHSFQSPPERVPPGL
jgi:hypothetical protein